MNQVASVFFFKFLGAGLAELCIDSACICLPLSSYAKPLQQVREICEKKQGEQVWQSNHKIPTFRNYDCFPDHISLANFPTPFFMDRPRILQILFKFPPPAQWPWACGPAGPLRHGPMGAWAHRPMGLRAHGSTGPWPRRHGGLGARWPMSPWARGAVGPGGFMGPRSWHSEIRHSNELSFQSRAEQTVQRRCPEAPKQGCVF